ncbi:hypothetical protein AVEN_257804-1 [Araneus ventricosus]|uniref:Ras-related and estrogen-regulated growth inhibitor n=1 Tax=Araneus ventricosus TaxID=182803 RepID=A0A4Y2KEL1_ARAVE|nr:hypothetical protein AVEN_257804-1 [Araneus ventricosus]
MEKHDLEFLVIGDPGSGKMRFIEKFLAYYEADAEIRRKKVDSYVSYILNKRATILMHDVKDIDIVKALEFEVHGIFFCYSSNHRESFKNLKKHWIKPLESKTQNCFLVANESDLYAEGDIMDQQQQVSKEEVERLKHRFKLQWITEYDKIESIIRNFLDTKLPLKLSYRRRSSRDLSHQEDPAQGQSSPNSSSCIFKRRRRITPYVKRGRARSID